MIVALPASPPRADEERLVIRRRYREARAAGLDHLQARAFAHDRTDIGQLRKLVAGGCPPGLISRILL